MVLAAPIQWSKWDYERFVQIAFEQLNVTGLVLMPEPLLAIYGYGIVTSIVIDLGWSKTGIWGRFEKGTLDIAAPKNLMLTSLLTDFIPIADSSVYTTGLRSIPLCLTHVHRKIWEWLETQDLEMSKDELSTLAHKIMNSGSVYAARRKGAKVQPTDEKIDWEGVPTEYEVSDTKKLKLQDIQSACLEALFGNDGEWGAAFVDALSICEPEKRVAMMQGISLMGAGSYLFHGIQQRIKDELLAALPITENYNDEHTTTEIGFAAFPDYFEPYKERTDFAALLGGAITAKVRTSFDLVLLPLKIPELSVY